MRVPIRIVGTATTFFWLFLIVFFVSAVHSVKDVNFDLGEPQIDVTSDNKILFFLPVTIDNKGYYSVGSLNITTKITDNKGFMITRGSTFIPKIEKGRETTTTHNMTIDVNDLLQSSQDYLFNDTELEIHEIIGMKLAEVIPVQASTNFSMPWGAPLYNFTLGEIEYIEYNQTHTRVIVPISLENHAFFDLAGGIQIRMYNNTNAFLGEGQTSIEAPQNSPYQGYVKLNVSVAGISENGYFEVYFLTTFFNFGPLVVPYG